MKKAVVVAATVASTGEQGQGVICASDTLSLSLKHRLPGASTFTHKAIDIRIEDDNGTLRFSVLELRKDGTQRLLLTESWGTRTQDVLHDHVPDPVNKGRCLCCSLPYDHHIHNKAAGI